ncbi:MAG: DUF4197 domain-containing protein [Steroidobacteraceae bacterium]
MRKCVVAVAGVSEKNWGAPMKVLTRFNFAIAIAGWLCAAAGAAFAAGIADISNLDASRAIKGALEQGASSAVAKLGTDGGFLNDPQVKIPLPPALENVSKGLRMLGRGQDADELVVAMNHAAEAAVPMAKPLLVDAVKSMSISDAKNILSGGDGAVTRFFRDKTQSQLSVRFMPIVKKATDRVGLAEKYDQLAGQGEKLGLIRGDAASIERYVTAKALDGLYLMIGREEHTLRTNPAAAASSLVTKVFGSLR